MEEVTMLQLIAFTIAIVEGIKQTKIPHQYYTLCSVIVGGALAAVVEFAPDVWVRIVPILTVGLAAAGLYSISKRAGIAAVNRVK